LQVRKAAGQARLRDLKGIRIDRLALVESRSIKNQQRKFIMIEVGKAGLPRCFPSLQITADILFFAS